MSAFSVSQWAPANETAYDLYVERTNFDGFSLGVFGYGIQCVIAYLCCQTLLSMRKQQPRTGTILLVYVVVIWVLGTIGNAGNMKLSELAFVDNRDYPGGPNAYLDSESSAVPINLACYAAYIMATWMQDGFLLYRFLIVFGFNWWLFTIPFLVYILSIVMSCFLLVQLTQHSAALFSSSTFDFALGYWASSISTTVVLTCLIVGRLIHIRLRLKKAVGKHHQTPYLSLSALLIESALLYSLFAVAFIVLYAKNDPFQNVLFPVLGQVQIIAPELIILRVAWGRSFDRKVLVRTTTDLRNSRRSDVVTLPMAKIGGGNGFTTLQAGSASFQDHAESIRKPEIIPEDEAV